jgi:hypothetical protein
MSDLVKRLRKLSGPEYPDHICGKLQMGKAADRIEALEAALRQARGALQSAANTAKVDGHAFRPWRHDAADSVAAIDDLLKD